MLTRRAQPDAVRCFASGIGHLANRTEVGGPAFALLRRGIRRWQLARFTEPKLAGGERRMVDDTRLELVTSALRTRRSPN